MKPDSQPPDNEQFPQQDKDTPDVRSLSDYIAQHLQSKKSAFLEKSESFPPGLSWQQSAYNAFQSPDSDSNGMVLHHLDTQLVSNHLERYLPTQSTRVHIMRERLDKDLKAIYAELNQYRQFQGTEYQQKIEALEKRANLLQRKIFDLDLQISKLNPLQSVYKTLQKFGYKPRKSPASPKSEYWEIFPNRKQLRNEASAINGQLQSLQHILENRLHEATFTADQLSRLINQYDFNLRKAEKLMSQLRKRSSIGALLGDKIHGWYSSFYNK